MPSGSGYDVTGLAVKVEREGITEAARDLGKLEKAADGAEKEVDQLGDESRAASKALTELDRKTAQASKSMGTMGKMVAGISLAAFAAAATAATAAIVQTGAKFETLGIQMESVTGSSQAAAESMDWITTFVADTPYQLEQVSNAFVKLKAVGMDPMNGTMQAIADMTSYLGGSMEVMDSIILGLSKSYAKGKMTAEEMMVMLERGVPVVDILAERLGVANDQIFEMSRKGELTRDVLDELIAGMNELAGGSSAALMDSFTGKWSNLQDQITLAMNEMAQGGLLDAATQAVSALIDKLQEMRDSGTFEEFGQQMGGALMAVADAMPEILDYMTAFLNVMMELVPVVVELGKILAIMWAVGKLQAYMQLLASLPALFAGAAAGATTLTAAMGPLAIAIGGAVVAGEALAAWFDTMNQLTPEYKEGLDELTRREQAWNETLTMRFDNLQNASAMMQMSIDESFALAESMREGEMAQGAWAEMIGIYNALLNESAVVVPSLVDEIERENKAHAAAAKTAREQAEALKLLKKEIKEATAATQQLLDFAVEAYEEQWQATVGNAIRTVQQGTQDMQEYLNEMMLPIPEHLDKMVEHAEDSFDILQDSFSSMLGKGFMGELDSFSDMWDEVWQDLAKSMVGIIGDAFSDWLQGGKKDAEGNIIEGTGGFMQSLGDMSAGQRVGMGIAGAGMAYQGMEQGGTAGALQGAMGGAMAGFAVGGPWGAVVGAVVGGLASYFGGGEDIPTTNIQRLGPGAAWQGGAAGIATMGQDMTAREDRVVSMGLGMMYRDISDQWRNLLRGFGDSELFELLGDMPEIVDQSFQMTAAELETWLREDKLPILFQQQYARAIRSGLRNLEMTSDAMDQLFDELRDMPGTERMEALIAVVGALRTAAEMISTDWDAITAEAGKSPMEDWIDSMGEAGEAMELLTAGWEEMSLVDRASDLQEIGVIFEQVTQSTISMLRQLEQVSRSLDAMFATTIEGFTTRGMDEDALWAYYEERYNYYNNLLQTTDDPNLILEYTQRMLQILQSAGGMLTEEQWLGEAGDTGMTWQEWFLSVTRDAQAAADAAVQEQIDRVQEQYELLWGQMGTTRDWFMALSEAIDPIISPLGEVPPRIDEFRNALIRATEAINGFGAHGMPKSTMMPQELKVVVEQEPPNVVVNINGSLAQLQTMVATEVNRRALVTERVILNAIS